MKFITANIPAALWAILKAVLFLILAFIVAAIAKALVLKLIDSTKLRNLLDKADAEDGESGTVKSAGTVKNYIGKLVYLIVFLLFVPSIFGALGVDSIAAPVLNLLQTVWGYVPNILAAAVILIVGFLIAKLVRQLLIPLFQKIPFSRLQEKAGMETTDRTALPKTLAYIVYVLIVIPVVIVALQALNIRTITEPAINMLNKVIGFLPSLVVGILITVAGVMIGKFVGSLVNRLLGASGLDEKVSGMLNGDAKKFRFSRAVGTAVQAVIIIFFAVEGLNILNLSVLTNVGAAVINYMPKVLASIIIIFCALILASFVSGALVKNGFGAYAFPAKIAIYILAGFMLLNQLNIASGIVKWGFIIILAAAAVAFAIAFGVGGRHAAEDVLKDIRDRKPVKKIPEKKEEE